MFQIPYLPELTFWANDYRMLDKIFRGKKAGLVNKANFTDKDLEVWGILKKLKYLLLP